MKTMTILRFLLLTLACMATGPLYAAAESVGVVTHLSGILTVKRGESAVRVLSVKSTLNEGDILSTEKEAYARIKFIDLSEIVIRPNTVLKIAAYAYKEEDPKGDKAQLEMLKGGMRFVSGLIGKRNRDAVTYDTPTATIGIRGTHAGVLLCNNDCADVPTYDGQTPLNGTHFDVVTHAIAVTPKLLPALPGAASVAPARATPGSVKARQLSYLSASTIRLPAKEHVVEPADPFNSDRPIRMLKTAAFTYKEGATRGKLGEFDIFRGGLQLASERSAGRSLDSVSYATPPAPSGKRAGAVASRAVMLAQNTPLVDSPQSETKIINAGEAYHLTPAAPGQKPTFVAVDPSKASKTAVPLWMLKNSGPGGVTKNSDPECKVQ